MRKKSIWIYTIIGGLAGLILGIIVSFLDEKLYWIFTIIAYPTSFLIPGASRCSELACAFYYVSVLIIGYTILGLLAGILFYYLGTKKWK